MLKLGLGERRPGTIDNPATTVAVAITPMSRIHNGIFFDSPLRSSPTQQAKKIASRLINILVGAVKTRLPNNNVLLSSQS
jgi:hypothetical protein